MTGYPKRVRALPPLHALKLLTAVKSAAAQPVSSSRFSMRKYAGMVLVMLAFAGCSVPVVILAMHTAEYVFGW
jgi:hypothetical protein